MILEKIDQDESDNQGHPVKIRVTKPPLSQISDCVNVFVDFV